MAMQSVSDGFPARTAGPRTGSIGLVLLVALTLVASAVGLLFVGRGFADNYILALLAALAVVGVFSLFAGAAGLIRLASSEPDPMRNGITESSADGILVTDHAGRVLYANPAYRTLIDAADPQDVRPVERVFVGDPDVSEAV